MGGCDTTSSIYNQKKTAIMNLIVKESPEVLEISDGINSAR